tara:strand:+ start:1373 stop:4045 length:2673 start_codon:yes stop_codon:yes gene_type:complete
MVIGTAISVIAAGGLSTSLISTGFVFAGAFGWTAVAYSILTNVVLGAAMRALTPKPSIGGNRGYQTTAIGTALDHQVIYGSMKVAGARIYDETTGNNNKYLHRILAVAGHEVESFDEIYVNDELVTLDVDGNVTSPEKYDGKLRFKFHLGATDQTADADLVSESFNWTTEHTLNGIAYMYIRLKFNANTFPNGIPEFTAVVRGKKVYDPRTSLTAWSNNPALCTRDYLTSSYGLDEDTANVDDALVTTAANVCDQLVGSPAINIYAGGVYKIKTVGDTDFTAVGAADNNVGTVFTATGVALGTGTVETARYTCNGAFTLAITPYDLINSMLTSMDGSMWYAQGKWRIKPAYWSTPVLDLNEDDLRSNLSVSTRHSRRDNFNTVKGTFRGEESNWQTTDYPEVTNAAFLTTDNNQESVADIDLPFTDNSVEARRIALISLERNRQQLTVNASFGLKTLQVQVGDNIRLTNSRFGWTNKEFEVVAWNFGLTDGLDLQTQMTLRETAESVYDEVSDGAVYERDNTTLLSPFDVPPVGLSAVSRTQVIREKLTNVITLNVTSAASERIDYVESEFKLSSDADWITLGTGQLGKFEALDLEDGDYDFRARAINTFGNRGEWEFLFAINASGLLEPPSDVTGFFAEVNGAVITLDWNAVPDLDLSYYVIRYSPDLIGASWGDSLTYVDKVSRPASSVSIPARAGTYMVKAVDKSGITSINYTSVAVPAANIEPLANTLSLTDSPTFSGAKTNSAVVSSELRIDDYTTAPSEGEYLFSNYIETSDNSVKRCRVYVSGLTLRFDSTAGLFDDQAGLFDAAPGLFNDLGGNSQFSDTNIITYVSTTQDDPSGTPTWTDYTSIKVADLSARAFRFKVKLTSTANNITPSVSALTAYVEYN